MESTETTDEPHPWWGPVTLDEGAGGRWAVGPLTLWLYRSAQEWRILHRPPSDPTTASDPMLNRSRVTVPIPDDDLTALFETDDDALTISRYSFRRAEPRVSLQPALADRPVVSRPEYPLFVPPGESVTLYLSTPLWARVELVESERLLQEVPSYRMSDTWFGATTVDGELCYATRTAGRLHLNNVPRRYHRAMTPLRVKNTAKDALALERVQLPVQHLALYTTSTDQLWTQGVTMTRSEGREGADVQVRSGPPADADGATRIREPRESTRKGLFTSTFGAVGTLFSS